MKHAYTLASVRRGLLAAALVCLGPVAHAQLGLYSFTGAAGSEATFPVDAQPANATFSVMARGTGVTPSAGANTFASVDWSTTALDANDYYSFSVTPRTGYTLRLDSLRFSERRSGTGIRDWSLRSSLDNFATDIVAVNVPDNTDTRTNRLIALPASFTRLATTIEFRMYGYNAESAAGSWRIDDVRLSGAAVGTTTSTSLPRKAGNVLVYPNPATDQLTIRVAGRITKTAVTVTDLMGRTVLKGTAAADGTFSLRTLPTGNYLVLVQDGNTLTSHKVSKQ